MLPHGDRECGAEPKHDLLTQLSQLQEIQGFVSLDQIANEADCAGWRESEAFGVASFYSMLDIEGNQTGQQTGQPRKLIRICDGPSCQIFAANRRRTEIEAMLAGGQDVKVERTSCLGFCSHAPAALFNGSTIQIPKHLTSVAELSLSPEADRPRTPVAPQVDLKSRPLSGGWGSRSSTYDRYNVLRRALTIPPARLIDEIEASDLRGRGGAGFNTGSKWRSVASTDSERRFVICNADESEPGTFKDRVLMERDPHLLLAAMAICGHAVGSSTGIIYIRGEYCRAAEVLERAIHAARDARCLGSNIGGTEFSFDISIHRGAGAYICGEETALIESLEGKRGEPRSRPPYPTTAGYLGFPTVVNNVETLCSVPFIVESGAKEYRKLGHGDAAGTKLYCMSGHVAAPGVFELPLGTTLRTLLDHAGGMLDDHPFQFAVTGGAAGTFVSSEMLDVPLDYDAWRDGVALGSGGIMVANDTVRAVSFLRWILHFFEKESCGKCTPCRIGTHRVLEIVQRIERCEGRAGDIEQLLELSQLLERSSFCGLGQSVAWPIKSAIRHFRSDFEAQGAK